MRLRLYEVGETTVGAVLRFDRFPVRLGLDELSGLSSCTDPQRQLCCIDEADGQIVFEANSEVDFPLVNDAPLQHGPLMPGDRLLVHDREFIVSYERTAAGEPPPARYRIQSLS